MFINRKVLCAALMAVAILSSSINAKAGSAGRSLRNPRAPAASVMKQVAATHQPSIKPEEVNDVILG